MVSMSLTSKFKKGDLVIVDNNGSPTEFEIVSLLSSGRSLSRGDEVLYDAKESSSGKRRTISQDDILRLATPVDNSASLFQKRRNE